MKYAAGGSRNSTAASWFRFGKPTRPSVLLLGEIEMVASARRRARPQRHVVAVLEQKKANAPRRTLDMDTSSLTLKRATVNLINVTTTVIPASNV